MAPLSELHRSISHSVLDDVEDVMQAQTTPMEVPFTPALPKTPEAFTPTEPNSPIADRSEPYTPTEPDSPIAPTEVEDCDNEECDDNDSLLNLMELPPLAEGPSVSFDQFCEQDASDSDSDSGMDSCSPVYWFTGALGERLPSDTGTSNDRKTAGSLVHWSLEETFERDVGIELANCMGQDWFINKINFAELVDFERSLQWAKQFIQAHYANWFKFKIGITENLYRRWHDSCFGYKNDKSVCWHYMAVLYTAPTSKPDTSKMCLAPQVKKLRQASTGTMETLLIQVFGELPGCINKKGAGGDCPSEGSPHFCYVVASVGLQM